MSKLIALVAITAACFVGGCKSDGSNGQTKSTKSGDTMMADACPHCSGMQTAKADGSCPICGRRAAR